MSSLARNLTFALVVGVLITTAGAVTAEEHEPAPTVDELAQEADRVEPVPDTETSTCELAIAHELLLPDPKPQFCPDDPCFGDADCGSVCPRGGSCVYHHECPTPVCHCNAY